MSPKSVMKKVHDDDNMKYCTRYNTLMYAHEILMMKTVTMISMIVINDTNFCLITGYRQPPGVTVTTANGCQTPVPDRHPHTAMVSNMY